MKRLTIFLAIFLFALTLQGQYVLTYDGKVITNDGKAVIDWNSWWNDYWGDRYYTIYDNMASPKPLTSIGTLQKNLVDDLDSEGIWDELDLFTVYLAYPGTGLVNFKNPTGDKPTAENGVTTMSMGGYRGNATDHYLDLKWNPTDDGSNFILNDAMMFKYTPYGDASDRNSLGVYQASAAISFFDFRDGLTNAMRIYLNADGYRSTAETISNMRLLANQREAAGVLTKYVNGSKYPATSDLAADALNTVDFYDLVAHDPDGLGGFGYNQSYIVGAGGALTDAQHTALYTILKKFVEDYFDLITNYDTYGFGIKNMPFEDLEGNALNVDNNTATASYPFYSLGYYYNNKNYFTYHKGGGERETTDPGFGNDGMIFTVDTDGNLSDNYICREGEDTDNDATHSSTSIILDNSGFIYAVREDINTTNHNTDLIITKSDAAEDITAFTDFQTITGSYCYPQFVKVGADIFLLARESNVNLDVFKLSEGTFSKLGSIGNISTKLYKLVLPNKDENKINLIIMNRASASSNMMFEVYYLESTDGETWSNIEGTWSKDITGGNITDGELDNFAYYQGTDSDNRFVEYGFVLGGVPYFLVKEGDWASAIIGETDYTALTVVHWTGSAWERDVLNFVTPYSTLNSAKCPVIFTHDGSQFVCYHMPFADNKKIYKYVSDDCETWTLDSTVESSSIWNYQDNGVMMNKYGVVRFLQYSDDYQTRAIRILGL